MKKRLKKIILIIILIVSLGGIIGTVILAKKEASTNVKPTDNQVTIDNPGNMDLPIMNDKGFNSKHGLETKYILLITGFSTLFSLDLLYLVMSRNGKFYQNKDKLIIYILGNIVLISSISGVTTLTYNKLNSNYDNRINRPEESSSKEEVELDKSNINNNSNINLDEETTDVTITKGGTYYISGSFNHALIVDASSEEVELVLDNVTINNSKTAAIIGLNAKKITINLKEDSVNTLSDGGNSSYDGCIYSNSELEFTGTGKLIVNGNQNEGEGIATEAQNMTFNGGVYEITSNDDGINAGGNGATITINAGTFYINASGDGIDSNKDAVINGGTIFVMGSDIGGDSGIDTDDGYEINGGLVVALGTDMIETPLSTSTQKTLALTLDNTINKDNMVSVYQDDKLLLSFVAQKSFKTIIISSETLTNGTYTLYYGSNSGDDYGIITNKSTKDNQISVNGTTEFLVSKIINYYGTK